LGGRIATPQAGELSEDTLYQDPHLEKRGKSTGNLVKKGMGRRRLSARGELLKGADWGDMYNGSLGKAFKKIGYVRNGRGGSEDNSRRNYQDGGRKIEGGAVASGSTD